jgi:hypothetical protein
MHFWDTSGSVFLPMEVHWQRYGAGLARAMIAEFAACYLTRISCASERDCLVPWNSCGPRGSLAPAQVEGNPQPAI